MAERFERLEELMTEDVSALCEDHPLAVTIVSGVIGLVIGIPICVASYKLMGSAAGKSAAKELVKAGVWLGPTHP